MSSSEIRIEPLYVVDTHALIWYLTNDHKLGKRAAQIFYAAEAGETRLIVSAIVLAELYYVNQKRRWFTDFPSVLRQLEQKPYFRLVPLNPHHIEDFDQDAAVPEMHDRIIAGLARRLNAPLITADIQITESGRVRVIW